MSEKEPPVSLLFGLVVVGSLVQGFAVSTLWKWFVVPLGVPSVGVAQGFGLTLVYLMIRGRSEGLKEKGWALVKRSVVDLFTFPLFVIVYGFILNFWVEK